jgi:hypothetical protein
MEIYPFLEQWGIAGGLLVLLGYGLRLLFKHMGNHMNHNTTAIQELTQVTRELHIWLRGKNGE